MECWPRWEIVHGHFSAPVTTNDDLFCRSAFNSVARRGGSDAQFRLHLGIREPHRKALLIGGDLLERLTEIEFEVRPFGPRCGVQRTLGMDKNGWFALMIGSCS